MENLKKLHQYSQFNNPYHDRWVVYTELYNQLKRHESELNFPQVKDDVGILLAWLSASFKPKTIFEMGSGYGGSAFWFLSGHDKSQIFLTEKRDDLEDIFHNLAWPKAWKESLSYFQGDAFDCLNNLTNKIDMALVDGVKADYQSFLTKLYPKLSENALVIIDNTFLKGKIVDPEFEHRKAVIAMKALHQHLLKSKQFQPVFLPFLDGVTILSKLP